MENGKKFLYIYGAFLLFGWGLIFIINHADYSRYEIVQGMVFISIVTTIYFILVHLYYKSKLGKKIVNWSLITLLIINCICFYFVY